jgi:hypothetical protein
VPSRKFGDNGNLLDVLMQCADYCDDEVYRHNNHFRQIDANLSPFEEIFLKAAKGI